MDNSYRYRRPWTGPLDLLMTHPATEPGFLYLASLMQRVSTPVANYFNGISVRHFASEAN